MSIKYYMSRLWLSISLSFYLFIPYLTRYTDERNRFIFHWNRGDLTSLLFCVVLLGILFFMCFVTFYVRGRKFTKKIFTLFFISVVGVIIITTLWQLLKHILPLVFSSSWKIKVISVYSGYFIWALLGSALIYTTFKHTQNIKTFCITLCFITSLLLPLFFLNAVSFPSIIANIGALPTSPESRQPPAEQKQNIYIFIFDEWSYWRSFSNRKLIDEFANLKQFKNSAFTFHQTYPAAAFTFTSMPGFLFQTTKRFTVEGGRPGFKDERLHPIDETKTIYHHPRELGYYTCIVGSYLPYGELLKGRVDFAKSISDAKLFGTRFFDVTKSHFVTALLSLPIPFFPEERRKITHYLKNRFQVSRIAATHKMFKTIIHNQTRPTYAVFHYMIPHHPFIFNRDGPKEFFHIYERNLPNYYNNLAYLDKIIGDIISTLKKAGKFNNSLIIMTSDHSWRKDYLNSNGSIPRETYLIPLFIKLPSQKFPIDVDIQFDTLRIGNLINNYLDERFTVSEAKSLFEKENYFKSPPVEFRQPLLSD